MAVERLAALEKYLLPQRKVLAPIFLCAVFACSGSIAVAQLQSVPQSDGAVSTDNNTPEKRGDLYMVRKFYPEAAEQYRKAVQADPRNYALYNKLGIAYHQLQDYKNARVAYLKATILNPHFAPAVNNLAAVEYSRKRYKQAIKAYLKALEITPGDAVVYSNLGTAYFASRKFKDAMAAYKQALQIDPMIFQRSGRSGNIVQQRDERNSAEFNFYLAKTYAEMQDIENTLQYIRKAWEEGFKEMPKVVRQKEFQFLASEPRFVELVQQIDDAETKKQTQ